MCPALSDTFTDHLTNELDVARVAVPQTFSNVWTDMRNDWQNDKLALAEKAILRATNQESFTAAVDRYELAIIEVTNRERTRVTARVAVLNERVRTAGAPRAPFSREEVDFFRAQAGALALRKNELDSRVQLNTRFRENNLPLIDFDKPTGSSASSASPESLKMVLESSQLPVGGARGSMPGLITNQDSRALCKRDGVALRGRPFLATH